MLRRRRSTDSDTACWHRGTHSGHHRPETVLISQNRNQTRNTTNRLTQFAVLLHTALLIQSNDLSSECSLERPARLVFCTRNPSDWSNDNRRIFEEGSPYIISRTREQSKENVVSPHVPCSLNSLTKLRPLGTGVRARLTERTTNVFCRLVEACHPMECPMEALPL